MATEDETSNVDERLEQVLAEYLRAAEAGQPPNEESLLALHPDLADDLKSFFANRAALEHIAQPLKGAAYDPTLGSASGEERNEPPRVRYFGDYELLEELGRGGMGVVYKARQKTLNRLVALKMILSGQLASPADVQRFKQEAEAAANLDHPNITPIYETGEHEGQHYFSMKLIEGCSLSEALPKLRSDLRMGIKLLVQSARAVHHAHQRGVLHRDLKPGNVLLDKEGIPYVTDFGLAKRVEGGSDMTRTGAIVGTPSYMAPEQANATKQVTTAVDVYGLGAMLYELLTGCPPFKAESPIKTLLQLMSAEPVRPRKLNDKCDRDLETIALKCLEKDPAKRYDSAAAFADDADRWLRGEPIFARKASPWIRSEKWARRHPAAAALAAVISGSMLLLAGVLVTSNARIRAEKQAAVSARNAAIAAQQQTEQEQANAVTHLYHSLVGEAQALRLARGVGYRQQAWQRLAEASRLRTPHVDHEQLRAEAGASLGDFLGREPAVWSDVTGRVFAPQPDTSLLAIGQSDGVIVLRDFATGQDEQRLAHHPGEVTSLAFAPDGQVIFAQHLGGAAEAWHRNDEGRWEYVRTVHLPIQVTALAPASSEAGTAAGRAANQIALYNLSDGEPIVRFNPSASNIQAMALNPDGRLLAAAYRENEDIGVLIYDATTGDLRETVRPDLDKIRQIEFSRDGKLLLCGCELGVALYDTTDFRRTFFVRGDVATGIGYHPPSQSLVFTSRITGLVRVWNLASNREEAVLRYPAPNDWPRLLLSGDGQHIAVWLGYMRVWNRGAAIERRVLESSGEGIPDLEFSPDGKLLAVARKDRSITIWDPESARQVHTLPPLPGHAHNVAFSPDGTLLAVADWGGAVQIWTVESWTLVGETQIDHDTWSLAFSPDGKRLAAGGSRGIWLWMLERTESGVDLKGMQRPYEYYSNHLAFSPDNRLLVYDTDGGPAGGWDLVASQSLERLPFTPYGGTQDVGFLDDSLVVRADETSIDVWNVRTRQRAMQLDTLNRYNLRLGSAIAPSNDGRWAAANGDRVTVWDLKQRRLLLAFLEEHDGVWSLAFSPDNRLLATGSSAGELVLWDIPRVRNELAQVGLDWNDKP